MIRLAKESDAAAMLAIYKPFVENTAITFDLVVPTLADFTKKINDVLKESPWLVCEINGQVVGFAYAAPYRTKEAYKWTRELTVYVREDARTKKYATALYYSLIELLKLQNYRNVLAAITLPNIPSVSFHERFGFHPVGVFDNVGYKLGKSHKVGFWQLSIQDAAEPAKAIIPLNEIMATETGKKALKKGELRLI